MTTMPSPHPTTPPDATDHPVRGTRTGRTRRVLTAVLVTLVALLTLSGCARVQAGLAVQPDDTVDGDVVIATPGGAPDGKGPAITVPPELADDVDVAPYSQDGYVGSKITFTGLTFEQVSKLNLLGGVAGGRADLELRRVGGRIAVQGRADLTTVPVDGADVQLRINFPGEVVETNGEPDGGQVNWTFAPGEVGQINASVAATDPNAPSTVGWTLFLGALVVAAAGVAVVLAKRNRNPPVRT
ncbi:DUF3153 domain-containing protein [Pseudonocardia endophytica]|uniref:Uncharacterized protein DUF3153 n=1 Tax=Pseudonocardia endophytica TaxID=401976 RepID=A0A4R1HUL1_PSEEN|nr:DUF3153 domain-containing protein [Pseudonocardia endophytica]TCK25053.1 uncharacterized protein DUF3153 [Pseudonocardia endophytica]